MIDLSASSGHPSRTNSIGNVGRVSVALGFLGLAGSAVLYGKATSATCADGQDCGSSLRSVGLIGLALSAVAIVTGAAMALGSGEPSSGGKVFGDCVATDFAGRCPAVQVQPSLPALGRLARLPARGR